MEYKNKFKKLLVGLMMVAVFLLPSLHKAQASVTIKNLTKGVSSLGLLAYWPFDGAGVVITNTTNNGTAVDASGSGRTLTLDGADWHEETSRVLGKAGQGLFFNGGNNSDAGNFADNLSEMTVGGWFKTSISGVIQPIVTKNIDYNTGAGWFLGLTTLDQLTFFVQDAGGTDWNQKMTVSTFNDGRWHYAMATITGGVNGTITLYVDGVAVSTTNPSSGTVGSISNAASVAVGVGGGYNIEGTIDEVRIYNRALSATEILKLYQASSLKVNRTPKNVVSNFGLVGYWTLDGSSTVWSSDTAATTTDASGTGNTGTLLNMDKAIASAIGKFGQALKFDGVDDYISVSTSTPLEFSGNFSVSVWVKTTGLNNTLQANFIKTLVAFPTTGWGLIDNGASGADIVFRVSPAAAPGTCVSDGTACFARSLVNDGQWHNIVGVYDSADKIRIYLDGVEKDNRTPGTFTNNSSGLKIGQFQGSAGGGVEDEVRLYNRSLSAAEVLTLYNSGSSTKINKTQNKIVPSGLVGYWPFDGAYVPWSSATAATAVDASGGGNTGTLTNMDQASSTSLGKVGQALYFDGSNDSVDVADSSVFDLSSSGTYTWSFWVKPTVFGDLKDAFATYDGGGVNFLSISAHTTADANYGPCTKCITVAWANTGGVNYLMAHTSDNVLSANRWNHVLITYDGSLSQSTRFKIYIDGTDSTSTGDIYSTGTISAISPATTQIGGESGAHLNGSIDEFRFYNRKLTSVEISQVVRP